MTVHVRSVDHALYHLALHHNHPSTFLTAFGALGHYEHITCVSQFVVISSIGIWDTYSWLVFTIVSNVRALGSWHEHCYGYGV